MTNKSSIIKVFYTQDFNEESHCPFQFLTQLHSQARLFSDDQLTQVSTCYTDNSYDSIFLDDYANESNGDSEEQYSSQENKNFCPQSQIQPMFDSQNESPINLPTSSPCCKDEEELKLDDDYFNKNEETIIFANKVLPLYKKSKKIRKEAKKMKLKPKTTEEKRMIHKALLQIKENEREAREFSQQTLKQYDIQVEQIEEKLILRKFQNIELV